MMTGICTYKDGADAMTRQQQMGEGQSRGMSSGRSRGLSRG